MNIEKNNLNTNSHKLCLLYNYAQHYRYNIFSLMEKELNCDFVFGNSMSDVKKIDYSLLKNFVKEVSNRYFFNGRISYQVGVIGLLKKNYSSFIVLGDFTCISTWLFLLRAKVIKGKKVFLWTHGWYGRESFLKCIIKKIFFGLADGVFLYGNYARNLMIQNGIKSSKLFVIHNSLDYTRHITIRNTLTYSDIYKSHFKNDFKNLFFIGRLTFVKQLDLILFALQGLKTNGLNYNLTFIGNGEANIFLRELVNRLGLSENVWFFGECYDESVIAKMIYNADLCVSPGNVGLTAIHSMVFGTPVLTHNCFKNQMPEFEAIKEGVTGGFFNYGNVDSLMTSITKWFCESTNRDKTRSNCMKEIDSEWNPEFQINIFKRQLNCN